MEQKLYTTLIVLTIFTLIIATGCGGGNDGITTPDSISNQGNTVNTQQLTGSILLKIIWPQPGIDGSCIMASGSNNNSLTASMPSDTIRLNIDVLEFNDPNNILFQKQFDKPDTAETIVKIEALPVIKVIVKARAYDDPNSTVPISEAEQVLDIHVGYNPVDLVLGDYDLILDTTSSEISINEETTLTAKLEIVKNTLPPVREPVKGKLIVFDCDPTYATLSSSDGTTDDNGNCTTILTGKEEGTITVSAEFEAGGIDYIAIIDITIKPSFTYSLELTPEYSTFAVGSQNCITMTAKVMDPNTGTPQPLAGVNLSMSIDGSSTGEVIITSPPEGPTDEYGINGGCIFGIKPGIVKVIGEFPSPDDPNTIITGSCNVEVTEGSITYYLGLGSPLNGLTIPPDFESLYLSPDNETFVQVKLCSYDENWNEVIIPDEEIKLTIVNHDAEFEGGGNTTTKITNYQDECYAILTTDPTNPGPRDIVVQAEYVPDPDKPWITPPEPVSCTVHVSDGLVFSDDFESYQTDVPYAELW